MILFSPTGRFLFISTSITVIKYCFGIINSKIYILLHLISSAHGTFSKMVCNPEPLELVRNLVHHAPTLLSLHHYLFDFYLYLMTPPHQAYSQELVDCHQQQETLISELRDNFFQYYFHTVSICMYFFFIFAAFSASPFFYILIAIIRIIN